MARIAAFICLAVGTVAAESRVPVVVELFTSEGCSSCPPADETLARLESQPPALNIQVIALSEHVDYWNQLGWMDRFSSALFTARQQEYGRQLAKQDVYTPQMIVNGQVEFNGSDQRRAYEEIQKAARSQTALVELSMLTGGLVKIKVSRLPGDTHLADMMLAVTETGISSRVQRGENEGRELHHTGVVRSLISLGRLDTKKNGAYSADAKLNLRQQWKRENLNVVLFVQDKTSHKIVGAATMRVPAGT